MRQRTAALLATGVALIALSMTVGTASASRLSVSNTDFRWIWNAFTMRNSSGAPNETSPSKEGFTQGRS